VCRYFKPYAGRYSLTVANTLCKARERLEESQPDLVIADLCLPDGRAIDLLPAGEEEHCFPVVLITSHGDEQAAVEAMKAGALEYVVKSTESFADMPHIAERALRDWKNKTERKRAEEALRKRTHDLGKRVKELNCLYGISKLLEYPGVSLEEIYQGTTDLIPSSWQYPDITCARITLENEEFITDKFKKTRWKQSSYIKVFGKRAGKIEVFYLEKRPKINGGPFLEEERELLDAIAERLGDATERKRAEKELREREEFNFALFKYNPIQTVIVDLEGKITKCNMAKRKSGDRLPVIGDVMYRDYAGNHQIDMHAELMGSIRTGESKEFPELKYGDKVLSITIAPFPKGAIITSLDITERKRAEEALREKHSRLELSLLHERLLAMVASRLNSAESFQNIMNELLGTIGVRMRLDNAGFYRFGGNYEVAVRLNIWSSNSAQQKAELPKVIRGFDIPNIFKRLKANESIILSNVSELEVEEKDFFASLNLKEVLICPLSIVEQVNGFICFAYQHEHFWNPEEINIYKTVADMITSAWERDSQFQARLEVERKHIEAVKLAEKTSRLASIGVMAAGITHEINQPLSAISITADSVLLWDEDNKGILPEILSGRLRKLSSYVKRIDRIIKQMKSSGETPGKILLETIDLNEAVKNGLSLVTHQIYSHGIVLQIELEKAPLPIKGNHIHLEQIVINLVVNAVQAHDTCEKTEKFIKIFTCRENNSAVVKVMDNGIGVPEEAVKKIFEPFYSAKEKAEGSGLGLAIVKRFVEGMNGSIEAENNEFGGATFSFRIPISKLD